MDDVSPPGVQSRRFPPRPRSVAPARRFVRAALEGAAPEVVDTAVLLAGELVTNAVLHARTGIEVAAGAGGDRVHVRVADHRPGRRPVPMTGHALSGVGLGLTLVEQLATRYGVETDTGRKTVWFDLGPAGPAAPAPGWGTTAPPSGRYGTVTLADLPGTLYLAARQHRHALLRELTLAADAGEHLGVHPEDLAAAQEMNNVLSARLVAALEQQPSAAHMHSLRLEMPADATPAVLALRRVLERAEQAARDEHLLTPPALPQNRAFRQWMFDEITGQLGGGPVTAWTEVSREPGASPSEMAPWDPGHIAANSVPMIAADDGNRIIAANGAAADMLGWQADELVGRPLTTLVPEHLRQRHTAAFASLLLTGRPRILGHSVPLPALHRDGRLVHVRLLIQTQGTADGRTVFVAQLVPRAASPGPSPDGTTDNGRAVPETPEERRPPDVPEPAARAGTGTVVVPALERLSLLADTAGALSGSSGLDEGLRRVCRILTQRLADWCVVDLLTEHDQVRRACIVHRDPRALPAEAHAGGLPPVSETARGPLARVLRGAGPLLLSEIPPPSRAASPLDARQLELFEWLRARSAVIAPLRARRSVIGALTVARTAGQHPFTDGEVSLIGDLVGGLALGVDNARMHQETQHIAERLQRSLLPVLPDVEGLRLAARYAPASATAQVGGDWYDGFVLPNGETALAIGDVAGHDLEAAVTMSQLRSMLRGVAVDRQEPPEVVLRRLDAANHTLSQEATATCVYAVLNGSQGRLWQLKHSSAGHLPPLLTTTDGRTRHLERGSGLMLGVDPDEPRRGATTALPDDSTVLLYTDGLIERRDESLSLGMERLRRQTAALAREPLEVFCDELLIGLGADNADDIAVLALRPLPRP